MTLTVGSSADKWCSCVIFAGARNANQTDGKAAAGKMILSRQEPADIDGYSRGVGDYLEDDPVKTDF